MKDSTLKSSDTTPRLVLAHQPCHLGCRAHRVGEAGLDEVEELVGQGVLGVDVDRRHAERTDVEAVQGRGRLRRGDRIMEGDPARVAREATKLSEIATAVGGRHEEEVEAAPLDRQGCLDEHLEVAATDRGPAVHQSDASGLERAGLEVLPDTGVAHDPAGHAVVLGVALGEWFADRCHGTGLRQVDLAQPLHERPDEQPPRRDVGELCRSPLVHVGPDGGTLRDPVGEGQGACVVGHHEVEALVADELEPAPNGRRVQLDRPQAAGGQLGDPERGAGQGVEAVGDLQVGGGGVRLGPVAERGHVAVPGQDVDLTQDSCIASQRGQRDAQNPWPAHIAGVYGAAHGPRAPG